MHYNFIRLQIAFSLPSFCCLFNHNGCTVQAYITCGISQNNVKRAYLLFKVGGHFTIWTTNSNAFDNSYEDYVVLQTAYNVGGQTINADTIQCSVLKCRMPRPSQVWSLSILFRLLQPPFLTRLSFDRNRMSIGMVVWRCHCLSCYSRPKFTGLMYSGSAMCVWFAFSMLIELSIQYFARQI